MLSGSRTVRMRLSQLGAGALVCAVSLAGAPRLLAQTEVRSVSISDLFVHADQVALVRIVAGDMEHYGNVVYKAVVETAYKGTRVKEVVYVGPYAGLGVGAEYVLFLQNGEGVRPKNGAGLSFGVIPRMGKIMSAGYAALPVGYECVFDDAIERHCDDSVEVNPVQIVLPRSLPTFPQKEAEMATTYKIWVRRSDFLPELQRLSSVRPLRPQHIPGNSPSPETGSLALTKDNGAS
jgi:hypothetical protein